MMNIIIKITIAVVFVLGLIAPFSFIKPLPIQAENVTDDISDVEAIKAKKINNETGLVLPEDLEEKQHQEKIPNFAAINSISKKKQAFFNYLKPEVIKQNQQIVKTRKTLSSLMAQIENTGSLSEDQQQQVIELASYYRIDDELSVREMIDQLLYQVDVLPVKLVLVQAANESAWGTSRFSRIGLNFFGLWCYRPGCGLVPNGREEGANHEVEKFATLEQAMARYFQYINSSANYREMRRVRAELRAAKLPFDASAMAKGLLSYSERGQDYVDELQDMLRHNQRFLTTE